MNFVCLPWNIEKWAVIKSNATSSGERKSCYSAENHMQGNWFVEEKHMHEIRQVEEPPFYLWHGSEQQVKRPVTNMSLFSPISCLSWRCTQENVGTESGIIHCCKQDEPTQIKVDKLFSFNLFCLTWLVNVIWLRIGVPCIADRSFVGVWGQLVIQFLWAVDKNRQTLHLMSESKHLQNNATSRTAFSRKETQEQWSASHINWFISTYNF